MKNISRRVFIKGMAVAAAATAASTVLAGCNIVPGKDETVPAPSNDNVLNVTSEEGKDKTLTVTALGLTKSDDLYTKDRAAIQLKFDNKMGQDLSVLDSDAKTVTTGGIDLTDDTYYVLVKAYADGRTGNACKIYSSSSEVKANTLVYDQTTTGSTKNVVASGKVTTGYVEMDIADAKSSVTLVVEVKKCLDHEKSVAYTVGKHEFVYNL